MINFMTNEELNDLYIFIRRDLSYKLNMNIDIEETKIVTGLIGNAKITEAIIIRFFPNDTKVRMIEDKVISEVHKYLYENKLLTKVNRNPVIERDVWLSDIRYGIVYTGNY